MLARTLDALTAVRDAAVAERKAAFALTDAENALRDRVREAFAAGADLEYVTMAAKTSISMDAQHVAAVAKAKRAK